METTAIVLLAILGVDVLCAFTVEFIYRIHAWRYSFSNKHVVITGGSSGLGLELAKRISQDNAKVTIVARNTKALHDAKEQIIKCCKDVGIMSPRISTEIADVCNKEEIKSAVARAVSKNGQVDILICNAGMAKTGYAFGQTIEDYQSSINVNYIGTVNTLFSVVPDMIRRNKGEIYLVGSTCSMLSYTGYIAYSPSKYAVKGLADGLRLELSRNNIVVGCIYPPNMDTPCLQRENLTKPAEGLFVEKYLESLFTAECISQRVVKRIQRVYDMICNKKKGEPHIYCDTDTWGVCITSSGMGPHNNIFNSLIFTIPAIIFTNTFRWMLLAIYRMRRFVGVDKQKQWLAGADLSRDEDRVYTTI